MTVQVIGLIVVAAGAIVLTGTNIVFLVSYSRVRTKLDRIKERAERVLEGEPWWEPENASPMSKNAAAMGSEHAARWLLKVIGD